MGKGSCPPSLRCDRAAADRPDHRRAVAVNTSATMTTAPARAAAFGPTGPDVLASASYLLPQVSCRLLFSGDVHTALFEALNRLGGGTDRYDRLRLADEARDMLAAYLVTAGQAVAGDRVSATVRGWVIFQDLTGVCRALVEAAGFWRRALEFLPTGEPTGEEEG
jgi:hypothetical protein